MTLPGRITSIALLVRTMLEALEKLLILQDRDHQLRRVRDELARLDPERQALQQRLQTARNAVEQARQHLRQLENQRRQLELEVAGKQQLIERYSQQQLQTRKNDEYQALAQEIERLKTAIRQIEDQELDLMEQAEQTQKEIHAAQETLRQTESFVQEQLATLQNSWRPNANVWRPPWTLLFVNAMNVSCAAGAAMSWWASLTGCAAAVTCAFPRRSLSTAGPTRKS